MASWRGNMARWREWLPVAGLSALMVVETFFDLRRFPGPAPWVVSGYLVVYGCVILICLPALITRWRVVSGRVWVMLGAAGLVMVHSLVSAALVPRPTIGHALVPRISMVMPPILSIVTMVAGLAVLTVLPQRGPGEDLWWPAAVTVVCAFIQWPRSAAVHGSARLATGMGGSAVVHVPLLLATGVLFSAFEARYRRWPSLLLVGLGALAILLTGSRAGVACLALAALVVVLHNVRGHRSRIVWGAIGGAVLVAGMLVAVVPGLRRLLNPTDELRAQNLHTALDVWASSPYHVLFGVGSGRLWPWFVFDAHQFRSPWRGVMLTQWGYALNSAHSTFLQVLVELGLVGLGVLVIALLVPVISAVGRVACGGRARPDDIALIALVATVPAFFLDTYLLKNYGASLWWWLVALTALQGIFKNRSV